MGTSKLRKLKLEANKILKKRYEDKLELAKVFKQIHEIIAKKNPNKSYTEVACIAVIDMDCSDVYFRKVLYYNEFTPFMKEKIREGKISVNVAVLIMQRLRNTQETDDFIRELLITKPKVRLYEYLEEMFIKYNGRAEVTVNRFVVKRAMKRVSRLMMDLEKIQILTPKLNVKIQELMQLLQHKVSHFPTRSVGGNHQPVYAPGMKIPKNGTRKVWKQQDVD